MLHEVGTLAAIKLPRALVAAHTVLIIVARSIEDMPLIVGC